MPSTSNVERFIARVEQNAHVEAIEDFYTETSSMRENMHSARIGRSAKQMVPWT